MGALGDGHKGASPFPLALSTLTLAAEQVLLVHVAHLAYAVVADKDEVKDSTVDKLHAVLGGTLGLEALLAVEEHVVADCTTKIRFWKVQLVPFSHPWGRRCSGRSVRGYKASLKDEFDPGQQTVLVSPKMDLLRFHAALDVCVTPFPPFTLTASYIIGREKTWVSARRAHCKSTGSNGISLS